ncbi:hypothetical protein CYMTET_23621, partial [Cymbomonas tetramitiformis]
MVNPGEKLRLVSKVAYVDIPSLGYEWTVIPERSTHALDLAADPDVLACASRFQANLALREHVLEPGGAYTFQLAARDAIGLGSVELTVQVNRPPSGGRVLVNPDKGLAYVQNFQLAAPDWFDEDMPLWYQFGSSVLTSSGGGLKPVVLLDYVPLAGPAFAVETILPMEGLAEHGFRVVVEVNVRDSLGATTQRTCNVTADPPFSADNGNSRVTVASDLASRADEALRNGDAQSTLVQVGAIVGVLDPSTGSGARALLDSGEASAAAEVSALRAELLEKVDAARDMLLPTTSSVQRVAASVEGIVAGTGMLGMEEQLQTVALIDTLVGDTLADPVAVRLTADAAQASCAGLAAVIANRNATRAGEVATLMTRMAKSMLYGSVAGEQGSEVAADELAMRVQRDLGSDPNSTLYAQPVFTEGAMVQFPAAIARQLTATPAVNSSEEGALQHEVPQEVDVDTRVVVSATDPHDPSGSAELAPAPAAVSGRVTTIVLSDAGSEEEVLIQGLSEAVVISLDLHEPAAPQAGGGPPLQGGAVRCAFWSEELAAYSTEGCTHFPNPAPAGAALYWRSRVVADLPAGLDSAWALTLNGSNLTDGCTESFAAARPEYAGADAGLRKYLPRRAAAAADGERSVATTGCELARPGNAFGCWWNWTHQIFSGTECALLTEQQCYCTHLTDFRVINENPVKSLEPPKVQLVSADQLTSLSADDVARSVMILSVVFGVMGAGLYLTWLSTYYHFHERAVLLTKLQRRSGTGKFAFRTDLGTWTWSLFGEDREGEATCISLKTFRQQRSQRSQSIVYVDTTAAVRRYTRALSRPCGLAPHAQQLVAPDEEQLINGPWPKEQALSPFPVHADAWSIDEALLPQEYAELREEADNQPESIVEQAFPQPDREEFRWAVDELALSEVVVAERGYRRGSHAASLLVAPRTGCGIHAFSVLLQGRSKREKAWRSRGQPARASLQGDQPTPTCSDPGSPSALEDSAASRNRRSRRARSTRGNQLCLQEVPNREHQVDAQGLMGEVMAEEDSVVEGGAVTEAACAAVEGAGQDGKETALSLHALHQQQAQAGMVATAQEAPQDPGGGAVADPGGRAVADPGGRAVADPEGGAVADPGGGAVADPGDRVVADPGGRAVAEGRRTRRSIRRIRTLLTRIQMEEEVASSTTSQPKAQGSGASAVEVENVRVRKDKGTATLLPPARPYTPDGRVITMPVPKRNRGMKLDKKKIQAIEISPLERQSDVVRLEGGAHWPSGLAGLRREQCKQLAATRVLHHLAKVRRSRRKLPMPMKARTLLPELEPDVVEQDIAQAADIASSQQASMASDTAYGAEPQLEQETSTLGQGKPAVDADARPGDSEKESVPTASGGESRGAADGASCLRREISIDRGADRASCLRREISIDRGADGASCLSREIDIATAAALHFEEDPAAPPMPPSDVQTPEAAQRHPLTSRSVRFDCPVDEALAILADDTPPPILADDTPPPPASSTPQGAGPLRAAAALTRKALRSVKSGLNLYVVQALFKKPVMKLDFDNSEPLRPVDPTLMKRLRSRLKVVSFMITLLREVQDSNHSKHLCALLDLNFTMMQLRVPMAALRMMTEVESLDESQTKKRLTRGASHNSADFGGQSTNLLSLQSGKRRKYRGRRAQTEELYVGQNISRFRAKVPPFPCAPSCAGYCGFGLVNAGRRQSNLSDSQRKVEPLERLIGTAIVMAYLEVTKTVQAAQLTAEMRRLEQVNWEMQDKSFRWMLSVFRVMMLMHVRHESNEGWLRSTTLWNLIFLQQADGSFSLSGSLATLLHAGDTTDTVYNNPFMKLDTDAMQSSTPCVLIDAASGITLQTRGPGSLVEVAVDASMSLGRRSRVAAGAPMCASARLWGGSIQAVGDSVRPREVPLDVGDVGVQPRGPPEKRRTIATNAETFIRGNSLRPGRSSGARRTALKLPPHVLDNLIEEAASQVQQWHRDFMDVVANLRWTTQVHNNAHHSVPAKLREPPTSRREQRLERLAHIKDLIIGVLRHHPWMKISVVGRHDPFSRPHRILTQCTTLFLQLLIVLACYYSK